MAKLIFYDKEHEYELNGEIVPSVSEISRFISREIYGDIKQFTLDSACNRGTNVHKATELLDKYGEVEITEDIESYIKAYVQFRKDYGIKEYEAIEKAIASQKMKFAGTIDRVGFINNKRAIIDIKSSYKVQKPLALVQLNGYKINWEENFPDKPIEALYILHLKPDATYSLIEIPVDDTLFMSCYNIHIALQKKKRTKKENK